MHIAFASDTAYLPWCSTAIRSCLDQGADGLTVHLLHEGSLDGDPGLEKIRVMVDDAGATFAVHRAASNETGAFPVIGRFGRAVWLRLLLPDLLPDVDRVLYLDVDTLAAEPLGPLYAIDLGGAPLAAVANVYSPDQRGRINDLGIADHRRYFNSGVLLLDLDRLRAEGATDALRRLVVARANELEMPDQDALNLLFTARWCALHPRWNVQNKFWDDPVAADEVLGVAAASEARRSPAIIHFEGPAMCKPWHIMNEHPWRARWWSTLDRTPYAGSAPLDRGPLTTVLRRLPTKYLRLRLYLRLLSWRERRNGAG